MSASRMIKRANQASAQKHKAFMENVIGNIIARWPDMPEEERERCRTALMAEATEAQLATFLSGIGEPLETVE